MNSAILLVTGILSTSTALKTQSRYGLSLIFLISFFCFILFFPPSFSFFFSHLTQPSHVNHLLFSSSQTPACWSPLGNYRGIGNNLLWRLRDNRSRRYKQTRNHRPCSGCLLLLVRRKYWCSASSKYPLVTGSHWVKCGGATPLMWEFESEDCSAKKKSLSRQLAAHLVGNGTDATAIGVQM